MEGIISNGDSSEVSRLPTTPRKHSMNPKEVESLEKILSEGESCCKCVSI